jgi:hypothetical protein
VHGDHYHVVVVTPLLSKPMVVYGHGATINMLIWVMIQSLVGLVQFKLLCAETFGKVFQHLRNLVVLVILLLSLMEIIKGKMNNGKRLQVHIQ